MKNIVVVGGGTAGSIAALLLKKNFPEHNVVAIASSVIGIVGPGEGTTPLIKRVMQELEIPEDEFLKYSKGTLKLGILFKNWNKNGIDYTQPFNNPIKDGNIFADENEYAHLNAISIKLKKSMDELNPQAMAGRNQMIPKDGGEYSEYGYHIDSSKLVELFHNIMTDRGIEIIDDVVSNLVSDSDGNISKIVLQSGREVSSDIVIDSTGFKRLIIGKHYNGEYISVQNQLPLDSAIAAILPIDDLAKPYTESTALDYGWSWKIPLQHRYGCGYVYSSHYINEEQAEKELRSLYGDSITIVNRFKFVSGFYKDILIKNCLAIGLAAGFFEPLEATSIDGTIHAIQYFIKSKTAEKLLSGNHTKDDIAKMNADILSTNKRIATFLFLHYLTNKNNNDFWSDFVLKNKLETDESQIFKKMIAAFNKNVITKEVMDKILEFGFGWFELNTWYTVYAGNGNIEIDQELDKEDLIHYNGVIEKVNTVMNNNFKPIYIK